ncbi:TonB-dependent receptor [Larkinella bovis]|uniref:TonB-dependent receptor n=1 Tax=Larkinella bovis TaxID=683041 RepID=A0ABW0IGH5_9BACT
MKLTGLFLVIACLHVSAAGFSQKISLSVKNAPLSSLFTRIEQQSGYTFFYDNNLVKKARKVTLTFSDGTVTEILDEALKNQALTYSILDKTIVIKRLEDSKESESTKGTPTSSLPNESPFAKSPSDLEKRMTASLNPKPSLTINQDITIRGKVTEENTGALPGVSVVIKGTTRGTATDASGNYELAVPGPQAVLVFSYVGYEPQEVTVAGRSVIDINLKPDVKALNEVVVVGYGTQKKVNLTGAVAVLNMKSKENTPITNVSQALHGVSGLWVNQAGSKPGRDNATIRIRGIGTTNNSNPLVLVNGIEYDMNELNPNDIETVTVLKDASAAIYGSRAANGVILITTKTGQQGQSKINYSFSYGLQTPTMMPDVVWDPIQYMELKNQALRNEGKTVVDYSDAQIQEYRAGMATNPIAYPNINWFDLMMKTGYLQQHHLRFSGGTEKISYNFSLGYTDQDGINIAADHANRYSLDLNLSAQVTKRLRVGGNLTGSYRKFEDVADGGTANYFSALTRILPIFTPYVADGRYGNTVFRTPGRNLIENPMKFLKEGSRDRTEQRVLAKVFADYQLPFNIRYSINFGVDKRDAYEKLFVPQVNTFHPLTLEELVYPVTYASSTSENNLNLTVFQTLNWEKTMGAHQVSAMLGTSYNDFYYNTFSARTEGFLDKTLTDLSVGAVNQRTSGNTTVDRLASYFGRVNYSYDEKYLLEAIFRYDGSSRFARENRWGTFPGLSAGWRIDKEHFFGSTSFINLLKLRASYGKLGNQAVPLYSYLNVVNLGSNYSFNNAIQTGAAITSYNDPTISWETTTTNNLGLDLEAWQGKLGIELDVYKRRTSGILRPVSIPAQVGALTGPQANIGVVDNTGFELAVSHRNRLGDFRYDVRAEVGHVKNKVIDLNGETIIRTPSQWPYIGRRIIKEGYPIDSYFLLQADGIYQNTDEIANSAKLSSAVKPGYIRYKDINNDGKINGDDRVISAGTIPKYTFGFTLNLGYKGFILNTFLQGVQGISIYPTGNLIYPVDNGAGITKVWATDAWTPENPTATLPILTTPQGATENYEASTFWLRDGSYLRAQTIQLNYTFPEKWVSKIAMSKLSLFVNGQNLFTLSKFKDSDPERDYNTDNIKDYPMLKTFSMGLNATF